MFDIVLSLVLLALIFYFIRRTHREHMIFIRRVDYVFKYLTWHDPAIRQTVAAAFQEAEEKFPD